MWVRAICFELSCCFSLVVFLFSYRRCKCIPILHTAKYHHPSSPPILSPRRGRGRDKNTNNDLADKKSCLFFVLNRKKSLFPISSGVLFIIFLCFCFYFHVIIYIFFTPFIYFIFPSSLSLCSYTQHATTFPILPLVPHCPPDLRLKKNNNNNNNNFTTLVNCTEQQSDCEERQRRQKAKKKPKKKQTLRSPTRPFPLCDPCIDTLPHPTPTDPHPPPTPRERGWRDVDPRIEGSDRSVA